MAAHRSHMQSGSRSRSSHSIRMVVTCVSASACAKPWLVSTSELFVRSTLTSCAAPPGDQHARHASAAATSHGDCRPPCAMAASSAAASAAGAAWRPLLAVLFCSSILLHHGRAAPPATSCRRPQRRLGPQLIMRMRCYCAYRARWSRALTARAVRWVLTCRHPPACRHLIITLRQP